MKRARRICVLFVVALAVVAAQVAGQRPSAKLEQSEFSAEDESMKRPAAIPDEVMAILSKDDFVQDVAKNEEPPAKTIPATWFSASEIHLGSNGRLDFVVAAKGPLMGGNLETFWVFVRTSRGLTLALTVPAHDLIALRARARGYRIIEASAENCCTISRARFRFNGTRYEKYWEKSEEIN